MAKITKIEPQIPALPTRKKVAAYAACQWKPSGSTIPSPLR
jgi:hypothetical protein